MRFVPSGRVVQTRVLGLQYFPAAHSESEEHPDLQTFKLSQVKPSQHAVVAHEAPAEIHTCGGETHNCDALQLNSLQQGLTAQESPEPIQGVPQKPALQDKPSQQSPVAEQANPDTLHVPVHIELEENRFNLKSSTTPTKPSVVTATPVVTGVYTSARVSCCVVHGAGDSYV
jgi:hypothetical protein